MKRKNSSMSNSYKALTKAECFFILNELLDIIKRQRNKSVFRAARSFRKKYKNNPKFNTLSDQGYSNLLSNYRQKYSDDKIINLYRTKYEDQFNISPQNSSLSVKELDQIKKTINTSFDTINELYSEINSVKNLLEKITSGRTNTGKRVLT